jgi:hypothetical protein
MHFGGILLKAPISLGFLRFRNLLGPDFQEHFSPFATPILKWPDLRGGSEVDGSEVFVGDGSEVFVGDGSEVFVGDGSEDPRTILYPSWIQHAAETHLGFSG